MKLMVFVFTLLVSLLAARPLFVLRDPFVAHVLGALPSSPTVRLSAAGAKRVARSGPRKRGKAVIGGEQRRLSRKTPQVEVISKEKITFQGEILQYL